MIFCTHQEKYAERVYNAQCYSFCCLKWRHLVKFLPLDNAASKLNGLLTVILTYALKTWYSVMVDTSNMFVELKSTTLVLWT